jgi:putative redox protein
MSDNNYRTIIHYGGDEFFIGTSPSGHAITIDNKSDRHSAPTPVELLLIAVGSCTAVDVVSILEKKRQIVSDYKIELTAERRAEHPRAVTKINVHHIVYGHNVSAQAVEQAVKLSDEKYCSVAATVRPTAEITTSFEIIETAEKSAKA